MILTQHSLYFYQAKKSRLVHPSHNSKIHKTPKFLVAKRDNNKSKLVKKWKVKKKKNKKQWQVVWCLEPFDS